MALEHHTKERLELSAEVYSEAIANQKQPQ